MQKCLVLMLMIFVFPFISHADTAYFKDGRTLENIETKETEEGIWAGGILFEKSRIDKIEKQPVIKQSSEVKESWLDKIIAYFKKKEKQESSQKVTSIDAQKFDDRMKKQREEEKREAEIATQESLQRAREINRQEELHKQEMEKNNKTSFGNQRMAPITVKPKTITVGERSCGVNVDTGERVCN